MTINILGTEYDYAEATHKNDPRLSELAGYHDGYSKIIRIQSEYNNNHPYSTGNIEEYKKEVRRHELTHAFLFESGLHTYCANEQLVEWISMLFPKMLKAFREVDAL